MRPLKCVVGRHDWHVTDHDQVTQRVTRECSKCGARRRFVSDPREQKLGYGYPEGHSGFDGGL